MVTTWKISPSSWCYLSSLCSWDACSRWSLRCRHRWRWNQTSERVGAEGKHGDRNPPNTHTHTYTHTHLVLLWIHPCLLPRCTSTRTPGIQDHLLPFLFFFFPPNIHPSAVFKRLVTYNPHLDADFPIRCVRVCLVGLDTDVLILDDIYLLFYSFWS